MRAARRIHQPNRPPGPTLLETAAEVIERAGPLVTVAPTVLSARRSADSRPRGNKTQRADRSVGGTGRWRPADQVLKETLKRRRDLGPGDASHLAQLVFGYYRWRGFIDLRLPLGRQIEAAADLAEQFARKPAEFTDEQLDARALPAWTKEALVIPPGWTRALQAPPQLWLRARRGTGAVLAAKLQGSRIPHGQTLPDTLLYTGEEDLFRTAEFHAGAFEVQDLTSQAVGVICAPRPGETWWDACAGQGGKTLHLSDLMANKGLIWASDRADWRLQQLKRRAARAGVFNYRTVLWREGQNVPTKTKFDGVLVDAPCSGVGTWQRNPHARWTTTLTDVAELATVQVQLLSRAASAVKPGGKFIYSVCTLTRAETTGVADQFERAFPAFRPVAVNDPLSPSVPRAPRLVWWPQDTRGNGMFVAVWQRES